MSEVEIYNPVDGTQAWATPTDFATIWQPRGWVLVSTLPSPSLGPVDFGSQKGINAALPTAPTDVATKAYVDSAVSGPAGYRYEHVQTIPNDVWTIVHNLGIKPSVTVIVGGVEVIADVQYPSSTTVLVLFASPVLGSAYLV